MIAMQAETSNEKALRGEEQLLGRDETSGFGEIPLIPHSYDYD